MLLVLWGLSLMLGATATSPVQPPLTVASRVNPGGRGGSGHHEPETPSHSLPTSFNSFWNHAILRLVRMSFACSIRCKHRIKALC